MCSIGSMRHLVDRINRRTMASEGAVKHYSWNEELSPAERAGLEAVRAEAAGRRILDLGVGGGRTVRALREVIQDYYSTMLYYISLDGQRR